MWGWEGEWPCRARGLSSPPPWPDLEARGWAAGPALAMLKGLWGLGLPGLYHGDPRVWNGESGVQWPRAAEDYQGASSGSRQATDQSRQAIS